MSPRRMTLTVGLSLLGCGSPGVYAQGLQALHDGSYELAARRLASAFRSSRQGRVGMELARATALSGNPRGALRAAERAWRLGVRGTDAVEFARLLPPGKERELWFERALRALEETGRGAADLAACAELAREYERLPELARRACLCARTRFGESALGKALSGLGYELNGDAQAAEREYRASMARDPGCLDAARRLGLVLARTGREKKAASLSLRLLQRDASARARLAAAEVALEAGKARLAEEVLRPLASTDARAAALLARAVPRPRDGLAYLVQARSRGLDAPELRLELARARAGLGETSRMVREGKEALAEFSSSAQLAVGLAELGTSWGEPELTRAALRVLGPRARAGLSEELARSGSGRAARGPCRTGSTAKALAFASCGKVRAAAMILEEAETARGLHELGWLRLSLGRLEGALRAWRSALAVEPGFAPARFELRRWKSLRGLVRGGRR